MLITIDKLVLVYNNVDMIPEVLTSLGLSEEEADVYLSLLNNGTQSAGELDKLTKVKRTYIYSIAEQLTKKGLVSQSKRGRTTVYTPLSPDKLLGLAQQEKQVVSQTEATLEAILPTLKSKYNLIENKPVVSFYEGIEGVKKVYRDTLKEGENILALVETSKVAPEIYEWVTNEYVKMRVKNGIKVKAIVASGPKTKIYVGLDEKELRETKVIPSSKFPFENEINIYGNKLALFSHKKGEKLLGIIIDNPDAANTFRSWFKLAWSKL